MALLGAVLAFPVGFALGVLLILNLIQVLGWGLLTTAFLTLLPPGLAQLAQWLVASPLVGTMAGLVFTCLLILACVFAYYWIASAGTPVPAAPAGLIVAGPLERFGRGSLIGFNTALNVLFLLAFLAPFPGGLIVSWTLAWINWAAVSLTLSNNPSYQVLLAYAGLFLPMNLPINLAGALVLAFNTAAVAFGAPMTWFAEWPRANLVMHGGVVHGIVRTAFNMSNYTVAHPTMARTDPWVDPGTPVWPFSAPYLGGTLTNSVNGTVFHETSHTLNVAAFGWLYHLVGWADQWLPMPWSGGVVLRGNAHSELCAESGLRGVGTNWLDMWAPSVPGAAVGNANAVAVVTVGAGAGVVEIAPVVVGGAPRVVCERNRAVTLNSGPSFDPDGAPNPIGHLWLLPTQPAGSAAAIVTPNAVVLTFAPDVGGRYTVTLDITDGSDGGVAPGVPGPLSIPIDALQALLTPPAPVPVGTAATVGGASTLTLGGVATLDWTILTAPATSGRVGDTGTGFFFTFDVDAPGNYDVQLVVTHFVAPAGGGPPVNLTDTAVAVVTGV